MSFLGRIESVMKGLGLKNANIKRTSFRLILSNAMLEDFITSSFQTDDQNRMNEMSKTENEAKNKMNKAENTQTEESESTNQYPFNLIKEESQESEKSLNCVTKSDLQKI